MKIFNVGDFISYGGSPKMIKDFDPNENKFKVIGKLDNGNVTYPSFLWECEYKGIVRLIMEQDMSPYKE